MAVKQIIFVFFIISRFAYCQVDTTWTYKKDKIVIPFELSNNLIILDVVLNGANLKMILDTGSNKNILFSIRENDSVRLKNIKNIKIFGVGNDEPIDALISEKNKLQIKNYEDENFSIVTVNESKISMFNKFGIEINGIIGYSFFRKNLIKIDYQNKKITIFKKSNEIKKNKYKDYLKFNLSIFNDKPYLEGLNISLKNTHKKIKVLIDTGLSDGLWLFYDDQFFFDKQIYIDDFLGLGLTGEIFGRRSRLEKLDFNNFKFNDLIVAYPDSIFFKNIDMIVGNNGIMGGEILKRFNIFLDYNRKNIFLKKNYDYSKPFNFNMSGLEVQHSGKEIISELVDVNLDYDKKSAEHVFNSNIKTYVTRYYLKPTYNITHIRKDSPASEVDLKEGDKIISINNKRAYNYTIQKITDLFQSEEGKKIKMEVERDGKIIEVVFYLKKII